MLSGGEGLIAVMTNPRRGRGGRFVKGGHHKKRRAKKRHRARKRRHSVAVSVNPVRRSRRRAHRNPRLSFGLGTLVHDISGAALGAGGALAVDAAITFLAAPRATGSPFLPATLATGLPRVGVRIAAALGVGWLAGRFLGRRIGGAATFGSLTVITYDLGRSMLNQFLLPPTMQLSESDYTDLSMAGLAHAGSGGYSVPGPGGTELGSYIRKSAMNAYTPRGISRLAGAPAIHPGVSAFVHDGRPSGSMMEGLNADLEM